MTFKGKSALVTGGARGIGRAIALELASRGVNVAFNYLRRHEEAAETQEQIENQGVQCLRVRAHLGDPARIRGLFSKAGEAFGGLDILVNTPRPE